MRLYLIAILLLFYNFLIGQTNVSGTIDGVWTLAGSPYILTGDITIQNGDSLIIEPGVEIRFPDYNFDLLVQGTLIAQGNAIDSIFFNGISNISGSSNSTHGGQLRFYSSSSSSILEFVVLDSLGDSSTSPQAILAESSSLTITNSTIKNSENRGIRVISGNAPSITFCNFENNNKAIYLDGTIGALVENNTFFGNSRDIDSAPAALANVKNNDNTNIYIRSGTISNTIEWARPGLNSIYLLVGDVTVGTGDSLILNPGTEIQFGDFSYDLNISGTLIAQGTPSDSIFFQGVENTGSNSNSTHGGNIRFWSSSENSILDYVVIDQMGDASTSPQGVLIESSSINIDHSFIRNCENRGIRITSGTDPQISNSRIEDNNRGIYINGGCRISGQNNVFANNNKDIDGVPDAFTNFSNSTNAEIFMRAGSITSYAEWPKPGPGSAYTLEGDATVSTGDTLVIQPGVEAFFEGYNVDLVVNGTLIAIGSATDSIHFKGIPDSGNSSSSHGGTIEFRSNSTGSIFRYVIMDLMGDVQNPTSGYDEAISINSNDVIIERSTIRNSENAGIEVSSGKTPTIRDCLLENSGTYGIVLGIGSVSQVENNLFQNNGKDIFAEPDALTNCINNSNTSIYIDGGNIGVNSIWPYPGTGSEYFFDGDVTVNTGDTLQIAPGVIINVPRFDYDLSIGGTLLAEGTVSDSIKFKGISNMGYNGNSTHGGTIHFTATSANSSLEYVVIELMGDAQNPTTIYNEAVSVQSSSVKISNSCIRDSEYTGIEILGGVAPIVENCRITESAVYGVSLGENSSARVQNNTFYNNGKDIFADPKALTNCLNNPNASIFIDNEYININSIWPYPGDGSEYFFEGDVNVFPGDTLQIAPGVIINLPRYDHDLIVSGTLLAEGTVTDSIRFQGRSNPTYNSNSSHGGTIYFTSSSSGSILDYVRIDSLGDGLNPTSSHNEALKIESASLIISNSLITNSELRGIFLASAITPTIQNCKFSNTPKDILAHPGACTNFNNIQDSKIYLLSTQVNQNAVWPKQGQGTSYFIEGNLTVSTNDTLMINSGVEVNFENYASNLYVEGTLLAEGTVGDSIIFQGRSNPTYNSNSSHGGTIYFTSSSSGSILDYVRIDSLGDVSNPSTSLNEAVNIDTDSLSILHSYITNSELRGVYLASAITPTIQNCKFSNTPKDILAHPGACTNFSNIQDSKIYLLSTQVNQNAVLPKQGQGTSYFIEGLLSVSTNDTLTINSGVEVNFENYASNLYVEGTLLAEGTVGDSIIFQGRSNPTYNSNSSHGGAIYFTSSSSGSILDYVRIDSLGDVSNPITSLNEAVNIDTDSLSILHSYITNSELRGVYLASAITPTIQNCKFSNTPKDILAHPGACTNFSNIQDSKIYLLSTQVNQNAVLPKQGQGTSYFIEGLLSVSTNDTLTINSGVEVNFENYASNLYVEGTLLAEGTVGDSIIFQGRSNPTYNSNSSHGGAIYFTSSSSGSILDYVRIDSLGDVSNPIGILDEAVSIEAGSLMIDHTFITNSEDRGVYISSNITPSIQNCKFAGNPEDLLVHPGACTNIKNNIDADLYLRSSTIQANTTWPKQGSGSRYWIKGSTTLPAGDTLVIESGVEVNFENYFAHLRIEGTLLAQGTVADTIKFLGYPNPSYNSNSTHGGEIWLRSTSSNSVLDFVLIDQMGDASSSDGALKIESSAATITNSIIQNAETAGVWSSNNAIPTFFYNTITNNDVGIEVNSGDFLVINSNIFGNTSYGIRNDGVDTVDARNNWWGTNAGPFHPILNPGGLGNEVTNRVKFDPWLNSTSINEVNDLAIISLLSPSTNCGLTGTEDVTVRIFNNGTVEQTGFDVAYKLDTSPPIIENLGAVTVQPGGILDYTFANTADLSQMGTYPIEVYTLLTNDTLPTNDTLYSTITSLDTLELPLNLLPAEGTNLSTLSIPLSWSPVPFATHYDIFVWEVGSGVPIQPTVPNLSNFNYLLNQSFLDYGKSYHWKIKAYNQFCESESVTQTFTIVNLPDLIVSNIVAPDTVNSGGILAADWTIFNQGLGGTNALNWYEYFYLSETPDLSGGNQYLLGIIPRQASLDPSQGYTQLNQIGTIPDFIQGSYYVVIRINGSGFMEADNGNNSLAVPVHINLTPPADLQVDSVIVSPLNTFSGEFVTINWKVTNYGGGPTNSSIWRDAIVLSDDDTLDLNQDLVLGIVNRNGVLLSDSSYTTSSFVQLPIDIFGEKYLFLVTDYFDDVFEFLNNDNNNLISDTLNVTLTPPVDLVVESIAFPTSASINENIQLDWNILNQGGSPTYENWIDKWYISPDTSFANAITLLTKSQGQTIQANDTLFSQTAISVPNNLVEGYYYFFVETDVNNDLFEFNFETNNRIRSADSMLIQNPDLTITGVNLLASLESGQEYPISWVLENIGNGKALNQSRLDQVFISSNPIPSPNSDLLLSSNVNYENLLAGDTLTVINTIELPDGIQGNHFIHVLTDQSNNLLESNENNNSFTIPINVSLSDWADLTATSLTIPDSVQAGSSISVNYEVKNIGLDSIQNETWLDRVVLSASPLEGVGDLNTSLSFNIDEFLPIDSSYTRQFTFEMPIGLVEGNYYLNLTTDDANGLFENTGEGNNFLSSLPIYVTPYPAVDLKVTTASIDIDSTETGAAVSVSWTVENISSNSTFTPFWDDGIYLSTNTLLDSTDILLERVSISQTLQSSSSYSNTTTVTIPDRTFGTVFLIVQTDLDEEHNDQDRSNNQRVVGLPQDTLPVNINVNLSPPCDLVVSSISSQGSGTAGQPIDLAYTVKNQGIGETSAGSWQDRFFISTDLTIDNNDLLLGSVNRIGNLMPDSSYTDTVTFTLPTSVTGNQIILVRTDYNQEQFEYLSETNNEGATPISITQLPPCDIIVSDIILPTFSTAGDTITIDWTIDNIGQNPALGLINEAVYLSLDTLYDENDLLLTIEETNLLVVPNGSQQKSISVPITAASLNEYYAIIRTDALNNLIEQSDTNNLSTSDNSVFVDVPYLPLNITLEDTISKDLESYYRLEITNLFAGEALRVNLMGDNSINASNELYLRYGAVPTRANYDIGFSNPFEADQSLLIPELTAGTYYLLVYNNEADLPVQPISLLAEILPFEISSINANEGGNTGPVTIRLSGGQLEPDMIAKLIDVDTIVADTIFYINPTEAYATFNLLGSNLGVYDISLEKLSNEVAQLDSAFAIVSGIPPKLDIEITHQADTRPGQIVPIQLAFRNEGNTDIPMPSRSVISLFGAPLGLTVEELDNNYTDIYLELSESGGPPNLRPGYEGVITFFTKATAQLRFIVVE